MTSERPDTAEPAGDQAPTNAEDEDLARALRDLTARVERIESGVNRLLSNLGPSASTLSAFSARTSTNFGAENNEERHSRIADRFAERAALQEQTPSSYLGLDEDDPVSQESWDEQPAEEEPRRRRRRSGPAIMVWVLLLVVIAGGAYYVYVYEPDLRDQVLAEYHELIDQEPDEVIPVEGQSPLPEDESATAQRTEGTEAEAPTTVTSADGGEVETTAIDALPSAAPAATTEQTPAPGEAAGGGEPPEGGRVEVVEVEPPPTATTGLSDEAPAAGDAEAPATGGSAPSDATASAVTDAADTEDQPTAEAPPSTAAQDADQTTASASDAAPSQTATTTGPGVTAAPSTPVESETLGPLSADLAPLPPDVSDEARRVAELALEGNPEAQHDLATIYALGQLVPQNYERASFWYRRSADGGIVNARYNLGVLTERGLGVTQDSQAAFELFLEAAEAGHPDAQNAVGLAYMHGHGVDRELLEAATWFQAASASGNARGAFHLGRLFEQGLDGPPDLQAAAGWYRLAAESGDPQAQEALDRVTEATAEPATPAPEPETTVAVPVPESTPAPVAPSRRASAGLNQEAVREIQRLLNGAGFDAGPTDGLVGQRTRSAIESFQQAQGLTVDGQPSWELLQALRDSAGG